MVYIAGEITSTGSPDLEPIVRKKLFPNQRTLIPFDQFIKRELRLQTKYNTPHKLENPPNSWKDWRVRILKLF